MRKRLALLVAALLLCGAQPAAAPADPGWGSDIIQN